jgi:hypothetical protein
MGKGRHDAMRNRSAPRAAPAWRRKPEISLGAA